METIILQGFLAGVIISLPKGPAGFFIIQQTIAFGSKRGLALSLGLIATTLISSFIILFLSGNIIGYITEHKLLGIVLFISIILITIYFFRNKKINPFTQKGNTKTIAIYLFVFTFFTPDIIPVTIVIFQKINNSIFCEQIIHKSWFILGISIGAFSWYGLVIFSLFLVKIIKTQNIRKIIEFGICIFILKTITSV